VLVANKFSFNVKISIDVWIAFDTLRTFCAPQACAWCVSRAIISCSLLVLVSFSYAFTFTSYFYFQPSFSFSLSRSSASAEALI
jgi:hypothetical protein